jgi:hypothetical protein
VLIGSSLSRGRGNDPRDSEISSSYFVITSVAMGCGAARARCRGAEYLALLTFLTLCGPVGRSCFFGSPEVAPKANHRNCKAQKETEVRIALPDTPFRIVATRATGQLGSLLLDCHTDTVRQRRT